MEQRGRSLALPLTKMTLDKSMNALHQARHTLFFFGLNPAPHSALPLPQDVLLICK